MLEGLGDRNYYPDWVAQPFNHTNPKVDSLIKVIDAAYHEMLGQGMMWPIDDYYVYSLRPQWNTHEGREQLISTIDGEFLKEIKQNHSYWNGKGITKIPELYRLSEPQRVALCQQLHEVLLKYPEPIEHYRDGMPLEPTRLAADMPAAQPTDQYLGEYD